MPTYCFTRQHYEISLSKSKSNKAEVSSTTNKTISIADHMKDMWSNVLGIPVNDIIDTSDFFDLGGDSLALVDLFHLIKKKFSIDLILEDIVGHSTFHTVLEIIEAKIGQEVC